MEKNNAILAQFIKLAAQTSPERLLSSQVTIYILMLVQ